LLESNKESLGDPANQVMAQDAADKEWEKRNKRERKEISL